MAALSGRLSAAAGALASLAAEPQNGKLTAQAAARLGFGLVRTSRPALDDMLLHLESMA